MAHLINRRHSFGRFLAVASLPLGWSHASAQFGSVQRLMDLCPAGTKSKVTISTEYPTASLSISIAGSGLSTAVPVQKIKVTVECEQIIAPPPPPPPPPPKSAPWDPFDDRLVILDGNQLSDYQAGLFYLGVSLPSFVSLNNTQPQLAAWALLPDGSQQSANFGMVRDGNGFRLANPSAADYWAATAASGARYGGWEIGGVSATSLAQGAGRFGLAQSMGALVISGVAGSISVAPPNTRGTNVKLL